VDIEAGVPPGKNALGPFRAQQLLADKIGRHLAGEDLRQPRVVDPRDPPEDTRTHEPFPVHEYRRNRRPVHSALGHQEMEVGIEVDPVRNSLDNGDNLFGRIVISDESFAVYRLFLVSSGNKFFSSTQRKPGSPGPGILIISDSCSWGMSCSSV
jgi:hypothetical protein